MSSISSAAAPLRRTFDIPSLDGVRAIAVGIVFVLHMTTTIPFWPGYTGVTIFFFLSGFLIVTLLRREWEGAGRISMSRFYLRRALRILPPAWILIAFSVVLGAVGLLPSTTRVGGVVAEVVNVTNYWVIAHDGESGLPPQSGALWSLSVEEHYYLVIPALLLVLLSRRLGYRRIAAILVAIAVVVLVWRTYLWVDGASIYRTYVATDTRVDALLWGSAMALALNPVMGDPVPRGLSLVTRPWVAALAPLVFVVAMVVPGTFNVQYTVQCLALVPIFWFITTRPESRVGRLLNDRRIVHLGVLSFSLYLFQQPIIAVVDQHIGGPSPLVDLMSLLGTLAVAQLVWMGVEKPCARLRRRLETRLPASS